MIFAEVLRKSRERAPDKAALVFGAKTWSYAELDAVTDRLAAGLAAAGARPDDRVAFLMPNCPELVFSYLACFKLGAIAVPLNHRYVQSEIEYALGHSGSTTLLLHADKLADVSAIDFGQLGVRRTYLVGGRAESTARSDAGPLTPGPSPARGEGSKQSKPFAELLADQKAQRPRPAFDDRQLATIMYTSGSTARPKGVVQSQHTLWQACRIQAATMQFTPDDVQMISTSASHAAASYGQLFPNFFAGGTAVLLDAPTPAEMVAAVAAHRVTRMQMLPPTLTDLVEYLEANPADLSSLRSLFCGGDVVPLETQARFREIAGWDVSEVCGMTETITYAVNRPFGEKRPGSVGQAAVDSEIKIIDERGAALSTGKVGEILIRSGSNMVGYWNDTLHTAAAMRDGWLASGDLGRLDEQGFLWFVGRQKEIIIRGGSNISPLEVEEVIDQHPAVHISGVVVAPDAHWGQVVWAYVAFKADVPPPREDELRAFVAGRIAAYMVPERLIVLAELPIGSTGKVDRKKLHEMLADESHAPRKSDQA